MSSDSVGLLWSCFNIFNILTFLFISKLADTFSIHRALFFFGLTSIFSGLLGIYCTPKFEVQDRNENHLIPYENITITTRYIESKSLLQICTEDIDIKSPCLNNDSKYPTAPCTVRCEFSNKMVNSTLIKHNNAYLDLSLNSTNKVNVGKCIRIDNTINKFDFANQTYQPEITSHICKNFYNSTNQNVTSLSITDSMTHYQFWLILLFLVMNFCGMSIAMCMGDTATFEILGENRHKFGTQRLFGSLAIGIMGISYGAVIDYFNQNRSERDYTSAFILSFTMIILSVIAGIFMEFKIPKKIKHVESGVWKIIGSMDVFLFLATVLITGISQGSIWCFYFLYMEDVSLRWDENFMQRNLLQGLSMAIGCFLGEVPFNHAAGYMMKKIGHNKLLAFGISAFSIRFILYYFVTNPWYFLPIEVLHGLSFGITCPVMFTYSSIISTPGTRATLQGITSAVFIGGVSLSSLVSGVLYKAIGGGKLFLYLGLMDVVFVAIFLTANILITKKEKTSNKNHITEDDDQSRPLNDGNVPIKVLTKPIALKNGDVL